MLFWGAMSHFTGGLKTCEMPAVHVIDTKLLMLFSNDFCMFTSSDIFHYYEPKPSSAAEALQVIGDTVLDWSCFTEPVTMNVRHFFSSLINCSEPTWTMLSLSSHYIGMKKICRHWPLTEYGTEKYCLTKCYNLLQTDKQSREPTNVLSGQNNVLPASNKLQPMSTYFS